MYTYVPLMRITIISSICRFASSTRLFPIAVVNTLYVVLRMYEVDDSATNSGQLGRRADTSARLCVDELRKGMNPRRGRGIDQISTKYYNDAVKAQRLTTTPSLATLYSDNTWHIHV